MTRSSCLVVAAMAVLCCLLPGASAIAQEEAKVFAQGIDEFRRGEYDQAISSLTQVVETHPDWEAAWYYLGVAQFRLVNRSLAALTDLSARDYSDARASLQKAIEIAPSRPGARTYLGRILEAENDPQQAKVLYNQELALKHLVDKNSVYVAMARVSYKARQYTEAMALVDRVLASEPRYVEAKYYKGLIQLANEDYREAIKTFDEGLKTLEEWRDKVFRLLRIEYRETEPDDPQRASWVVENWDELRKELWELRDAKARPVKETLEEISQKYARAQEFALELQLWPAMNKAEGDAYLGLKDWASARNKYRHAMRPREGEGTEDDADAWCRIAKGYFLHGKQIFEEDGLLLSAISQFNAAEGDRLNRSAARAQNQAQGRGGMRGGATGGLTGTTATVPLTPEQELDGYARALYAVGIAKSAKLNELQAPPAPEPVLAAIFDGLGELYLYQANTYASNEARNIISHSHDDALAEFDKALLFCPTYVPAMLHKAQTWISRAEQATDPAERLDDFGRARDLIQQEALALEPDSADLWAELAGAYLGLDDLDKASEASVKALVLDKKHVRALNTSGLVKYYRDDCVAAADDFTRAVDVAPKSFRSYLNRGNAFYGLQSWGRAQREYAQALQLIPQSSIANTNNERPYVLFLIARTQHQRKLYEKAIETLGEALKLRTDFYEAQRLLASCYSGLQQWRAAEEALRAALETVPETSPEKVANAHAHLGQVYEIEGRLHEAIAEYRIALATYPKNLEARYGLERLTSQEKRGTAVTGS